MVVFTQVGFVILVYETLLINTVLFCYDTICPSMIYYVSSLVKVLFCKTAMTKLTTWHAFCCYNDTQHQITRQFRDPLDSMPDSKLQQKYHSEFDQKSIFS